MLKYLKQGIRHEYKKLNLKQNTQKINTRIVNRNKNKNKRRIFLIISPDNKSLSSGRCDGTLDIKNPHKVNCKSSNKTVCDVTLAEWCDCYYCFSISPSCHLFWCTVTTNTFRKKQQKIAVVVGRITSSNIKIRIVSQHFCKWVFLLANIKSADTKKKTKNNKLRGC